ncbi:MAG: GDSL-type esterase/lipase family protein [Proteobacteria bacterium]|nr:GDSL-type esterase/lipase family protein [Pseudomonadota bacterium]
MNTPDTIAPLRTRKRNFSLWATCFFCLCLANSAQANEAFVVGAMGDSITRAFDASHALDNPNLSWATGYDRSGRVSSQTVKIQKIRGGNVVGSNVARSGGLAKEMPAQAAKLNQRRPDYVTILIGANDLCSWGNQAESQLNALDNHVRTSIESLIDSNPDVIIAISAVPNMIRLWEIGHSNSCQKKWDRLKICPRILSRKATAEDRETFYSQWEAVNKVYGNIAADFPHNVRFGSNTSQISFEPKHISAIDCFHPSIAGQNLLSNSVWEAVASDFQSTP